jgi:uncharacterized protein with von Willebrand factor type A (vWA) domain
MRYALLLLVVVAGVEIAAQSRYTPPRTPWGDPDIQGAFTNSDESLIPFERPDALAGRTLDSITPAELAKLTAQRNQERIKGARLTRMRTAACTTAASRAAFQAR